MRGVREPVHMLPLLGSPFCAIVRPIRIASRPSNSTEKGIDQADTAGRLRLIAFLNELLVRSKNVFGMADTEFARFWEKGTQQ